MRQILFLMVAIGVCSGCTYQYTTQLAERALDHSETRDRHQLYRARQLSITPSSPVYLPQHAFPSLPLPAAEALQQHLAEQLQQYFPQLSLGEPAAGVEEALLQARQVGTGFVFYMELLHYQDQYSSLSELDREFSSPSQLGFDHLWVSLSVWDIQSGQMVDHTLVKSRTPALQIRNHEAYQLASSAVAAYLRQLVAVR